MIRPTTFLGAIVSLALVASAPVATAQPHTPAKAKKCAKRYVKKNGKRKLVRKCAKTTRKTTVRQTDTGVLAGLRECANRERGKLGLGALKQSVALDRAAQRHADDMAAHDYFEHDSQDGRAPWDRIKAALQGEKPFAWMGENIARGFADADATCEGWMNSAGHRANILGKHFTHVGVGWHDGYAVQDFGGRG